MLNKDGLQDRPYNFNGEEGLRNFLKLEKYCCQTQCLGNGRKLREGLGRDGSRVDIYICAQTTDLAAIFTRAICHPRCS